MMYSDKVVEFFQRCCIPAKVVCIRTKWLYSAKVVVFGQKWLYLGKVAVIG